MYGKTGDQDNTYGGSKNFNATGTSFGNNPASLKGKLMSLEEMIKGIADEMNFHKKEV
jgi:hypothetical protein